MTNRTEMPRDTNAGAMQCLRPSTTTSLTTSGTAQNTAVIDTNSMVARICVAADTRVAIGVSATATATDMLLLAGTTEYFSVPNGARVSLIQDTSGDLATVTWMV